MAEGTKPLLSSQEVETTDDDDGPVELQQEKSGDFETEQTRGERVPDPIAATTSDRQADTAGQDDPDPASTQKGQLIVQVRSLGSKLPSTPTEPTTVIFYLLLLTEPHVKEANILIGNEEAIPLFPVPGENNMWHCSVTFNREPMKENLKYRYILHVSGQDFNLPFYGKVERYSKQEHDVTESCKRSIANQVQFDVFHFPQKKNRETVPKAIKFYLTWFFRFVQDSTLPDILNFIHGFSNKDFGFKLLTKKYLEELVRWILKLVSKSSTKDIQRFYLCVILSYLQNRCANEFDQQLLKNDKNAVDSLLKCLKTCAHLNLLVKSTSWILNEIATILVQNSSSPGWLTLAAHFYPYLGIGFLSFHNPDKLFKILYDSEQYESLVAHLFACLKVENQADLHQLLGLVLKSAPNLVAAMELSKRSEMTTFFATEDEKVDFFAKYFEKAQSITKDEKGSRAKLDVFQQIPKKILNKIPKLLESTLLEYSKSYDELKDKEREDFKELIRSMKDPDVKQLTEILMNLSTSKSDSSHDLLTELLNNDNFKESWSKIEHEKKVKICKHWVISCRKCKINDSSGLKRVVAVYEGIEDLMQRSLTVSIQETILPDVHARVLESVITQDDSISVLQAFVHIEKLNPVVQKCYISHVERILTPELIKKSTNLVKEKINSSSFGQELLLCILEKIDKLNITKNGVFSETDFKPISDWCDIWIILFKANGILNNSKKYQDGKIICQQLAKNILVGNISPKFTAELHKMKENVSILCNSVKTKEEPRQSLEDQINALMSVVESVPQKFDCLQSAIDLGKKLSHEVCVEIENTKSITETFNNLQKDWRSRKVNELQSNTFWGTLLPLLKPAETLQLLRDSMTFRTVAKSCLHSQKSDEDKDKKNCVNDFCSMMEFITRTGAKKIEDLWTPVFQDPGSVNVGEMESILGALKDEKELDKEYAILETYFKKPFSRDSKRYVKNCVMYQGAYERAQHINDTLEVFKFSNLSEEEKSCLPKFPTALENIGRLTLEKLNNLMVKFDKKISRFSGEGLECVFKELSCSSELVSFMEEIVDDDIRFLIDAFEEHFDQCVTESSVSDLIDVHSFLAPLIRKKNDRKSKLEEFLKLLKESCIRHKDIGGKIHQCSKNVHSLCGLYKSIANRGEMTKEIISNCLHRGEYSVSRKEGRWETTMSYKSQENDEDKKSYTLPELHDLRSRAHLLIATSHKKTIKATSSDSNQCGEKIDFEKFIDQVNLLTEISTLLSTLRSSGYSKYRNFEMDIKTTDDLKEQRTLLQEDKEKWEKALEGARNKYYVLNYYRSDQICKIYDFLRNASNVNCDEVLSLIHFFDPTITEQQLKQHQGQKSDSNDNPESLLEIVATALEDKFFKKSKPVIRPISDGRQKQLCLTKGATVTPGEIFVAALKAKSQLTVNVILTLYANTSNAFPEPYQIVFCSSQTTWEEIHLLLQRCFTHSKYCHGKLFCIANVELLPNEFQFRLVNALREKQNCCQNSEAMKNCYLALICRGGDHHYIVEEFAKYTHHIACMTDCVLEDQLKTGWPDVKMVTSTLPGLGKTERIKSEAFRKNMNIATVSISGPFKPSKLIQRLKKITINKKYHCLHLDIGEVSDPQSLDIFLFQLIVTGMVSAGNQFYHLPTKHIYIEIANTLNDRESLVIPKYFTRIHLKWQNYENLLVFPEITSDIQVVCQYLDIYDRDCIESEEVNFSGSKTSKALPSDRCQKLLTEHYSPDAYISFTTLHTFLGVLADQLSRLSKSAFFTPEHIKTMIGQETQVRKNLFEALLKVAKEFASRAIAICHPNDDENSAENMVKRVARMIKWEDSEHLLVVFNAFDSQTITAMYRDRSHVPESVKNLLKSQCVRGNNELEDFNNFTPVELQNKLENVVCTKLTYEKNNLLSSYALTPDNILKMMLIILRVRANVPVIIMGETGCGKSSLVRYLANTCGVKLCKLNFHAGITEEDIVTFINEKNVSNEQMWIFLDEINTCDHLGLINDIICHHSLLGQPLSENLVFLAACNPYKLRPKGDIKTAGLEGKNITDEYSELVYRVHPLPEAMMDYVWDYGSLNPKDERNYIKRMVRDLPKEYEGMLVHLLAESQKFIRNAEKNHFCVSLRDVNRCIHLISWFEKMLKTRQELSENKVEYPSHFQQYHSISQQCKNDSTIKSIVLALAHCYLSRLPTTELRKNYREKMMSIFSDNKMQMTYDANVDTFAAIVRMEEEDYLNRMELPPGTARNTALRENVFVMLVCILNRIPIFVVGKPGCSKSLSIQLIRSNLRGRDSRDLWFRELPQLYVVSYQGSESSTSEGINKVFKKARKYKSHNKEGTVLPVVLLDEVGLAENSKNNPLKVLHSLLETDEGKFPDVAVVGISNWSLDAAKMNRAIHLFRPEPSIDDLIETGKSLTLDNNCQYLGENELKCLAEAYFQYQTQQTHANFHGLRDYYSLIKNLTRDGSHGGNVNISLQRNFGGLPGEVTNIQKIFFDKLKSSMTLGDQEITPVTDLILANIKDSHARHLMLIGKVDSIVDILKRSLAQLEKEVITIFGSRFEEDLSEDYNYRILSRIILCMERNCILILKDLESIYGSLYDMLNQNYTVVGKRKICRVALGPYSNPMCQVHDEFRCIVIIDHYKVAFSDPPFLNRFEKQLLRYSDVLSPDQKSVKAKLSRWVDEMSTVKGLESHFNKTDMFIGFHEDTLPSLILSQGHETDSSEDILRKCKNDLMWIASSDSVLRTGKCNLLTKDSHEVQQLRKEYFGKPLHHGFEDFMKHVMKNEKSSFFASNEVGSKTVVMTFSNMHINISQCLGNSERCQVERLSAFKSEKHFTDKVNEFWDSPEKDLLVLQCKSNFDATHLLHARFIIEKTRDSYKQGSSGSVRHGHKHVCIVIHVQRVVNKNNVSSSWQFSFMCGWRQVFLDVLEAPQVPLEENVDKDVGTFLISSKLSICEIAKNHFLWCLTCIKYTQNQRIQDNVSPKSERLFNSEEVSQAIETLILKLINFNAYQQDQESHQKGNWQIQIACDRQSLVNYSTLDCALEQYVERSIRNLFVKVVYFLEKENAWPPRPASGDPPNLTSYLTELWCSCLANDFIVEISDILEPRGYQSYILETRSLDLRLPFSQVVARRVNSLREQFLDDYQLLMTNEENFENDGQLKMTVQKEQLKAFAANISNLVGYYTSDCHYLYMEDLLDVVTAEFSQVLSRSQRVSIAQNIFISEFGQNLPANDMAEFCTILHAFLWIHQEKIIDLLKMIDCCRPFIGLQFLTSLTDGLYQSSKEVLFVNEEPSLYLQAKQLDEIHKEHQVSKSLEDILVMAYCEKMFPSKETVNDDLEKWRQGATLVLSSAVKVSQCPPEFHFLRLCVDFSRIIPNSPLLHTLSDIGKALSPKYLDHEKSLERITDEIIKPAEKEVKDDEDKYEALQKFLSLFYGRCIDTNVDTSNACPIVKHVLSLKRPEFVMIMSPVILRLLMVEETQSPGIFLDLITNPSAMKSRRCLEKIDKAFKDCFSEGLIHHDSYPAVMICDLIQTLLNFDRFKNKDKKDNSTFSFNDVNSPDCEVLLLAKSAINLIFQNNKDVRGLRVFSAVAFLRRFFMMLAEFIARNHRLVNATEDSPHAILMTEIESLLRNSTTSLQLFFMKQLHKKLSYFDIQRLFEKKDENVLPTITELWRNEKSQNKAMFTPVFHYTEYEEAKLAYTKLVPDDESAMLDLLRKCNNSSPDHAFALFGILINKVYLKRAVQKLGDKEEQLVTLIKRNISSLPLQELLLRIIGRRDFNCEELQLSPESSVDDVEIALLILHVAWVVSNSQSQNTRVLEHDDDEICSVFECLPCVKESACVTCSCGLRIAFKTDANECPHCLNNLRDKATEPIHLKSDLNSLWGICTKHTSPAAYRAIHLIVSSSQYAQFAVGQGFDPECDFRSEAESRFQTIETDLSCLMAILSCTKTIALKTMHLVVEKIADLIREKVSGANDTSWKERFSQRTEEVFLKARKMPNEIKEMIKVQTGNGDQGKVTPESRILELDTYPEQAKEQNNQLKRLFRVKKRPSLEDFRSAFLHSPDEVQSKHSFLALFFAKFDQLSEIRHLHHLLKWSRLVSSALTLRISRKDAKSKSIDEFITDYFPESERTLQKTNGLNMLFNNFKEAWDEMCPLVDNELMNQNRENMPYLQKIDPLAYCLMEMEHGIYLTTAINILVSYQNSILDFILSISSHRHPALHALEKRNCSGVACVTIQNVKEKEIISFQWSDDVFRFAQNNPEYGRGQEITYDFERIEMELAAKIAFGKCHLIEKLNDFIFAEDLFHTCGRLLTEIRKRVKQSDELPEDVRKGLDAMKEQGMKRVQDLLQQIEVMMHLFQSELKDLEDDKMTLEDLAEKCSKILLRPFPVDLLPEPRSSIKVGHVCALYEALEDMLADGVIEGIARIFRKKFTDNMKESIDDMLSKNGDQLKPPNFLKVLRRFVFRHLSSGTERYWPKNSTPLRSLLVEPSLWAPLEPPQKNEIPREITLEYTHATLKYVEEKLNKIQRRSRGTNQANVRISNTQRQLKNFSNT